MAVETSVRDYLFRGTLAEVDPDVAELVRHETARQARYLIMIPSESTVPQAVREALSSAFHNIYAEGYPLESTRTMSQAEILDYNARLTEFRRSSDERYYKGTEYANIVESLARRRAAELFANERIGADSIFVNVQALSGAPANNAVYSALLNVGDTVMGMDLIQGGHLTHGSPVNRSGKNYKIISYGIDPDTQLLDYEAMRELALEHRPKMIIGGYSSYPHIPDWAAYRAIADEVGAYLLADVAHVAGLIAAGVYPNPIGIADVVTFTSHKTLGGPRGAVILTHKKALSNKIDRAVFPGEQGGPHMNAIAALAVALKLATSEQFVRLQRQTVANAMRLARRLEERGLHIPFAGTTTHLLNVDCKSVVGPDGTTLSGDMAARILDLAGIVCNRQTIPGDTSPLRPSGIRLGTPWITQRGFGEAEIDQLADIIADVLLACVPFSYSGRKRDISRAALPFDVLQDARTRVRNLAASVGIDTDAAADDYPHFHYLDSVADGPQRLHVAGEHAAAFLNGALTSDVMALAAGQSQATRLLKPDGSEIAAGAVTREADGTFSLDLNGNAGSAAAWLRSLSDGFVIIDSAAVASRLPGPVDVAVIGPTRPTAIEPGDGYAEKAFFIGRNGAQSAVRRAAPLPVFTWSEPGDAPLKTTTIHGLHKALGARMVPFAGYDMPVWYTSVKDEHAAVRSSAGIFDVTHMGAFDARGPGAAAFLDALTTNDVYSLDVGHSHYTYFLDVDGIPLDDLMIYRTGTDEYLLIVNASNNDKLWAWLNAVKDGRVAVDANDPSRRVSASGLELRDLRAAASGGDQRVDVALQGPKSLEILLKMEGDSGEKAALKALPWAGVTRATLDGFDLIISRTGYTGERTAFELFIHPDRAADLFRRLTELGATPCGLAARDSLRTEAGLPLYGHELAGPLNLNPADAGFGNYVKVWKPFFVGKAAYIAHEAKRDIELVRFTLPQGGRSAHQGDPLIDARGRVVGTVTSCAIDSDGAFTGLAVVRDDVTLEGTQLGVFAGSDKLSAVNLSNLSIGGRAVIPQSVTIVSRYPKAKK